MATIYPEIQHFTSDSAAERQLIAAFAEQLGAKWTLIHSISWVDATGSRLRLGECDFVALHPEYGWIAIEAKTGVLEPDYTSNTWRCSNGTRIQDPVKQAQRSMFRIQDEFSRKFPHSRKSPHPPFAYAVALPHTRRLPDRLPLHVVRETFILEGDMSRLEERLKAIIAFQTGGDDASRRISPEDFAEMLDVLLPKFRIVPSLSHRIGDESKTMLRLSEQQAFFLQSCRHAPRLLVTGPSGSGKTLLALEEAKRFAEEGAEVLLLCFNRSLADHIAALAPKNERTTVDSFHGFIRNVIEAAGLAFVVPTERKEQQHFFEHEAPELFLSALPAFEKRFDVVIVDEAQDFRDTWWICIEELLREGENSRLHLFGDINQNIFKRGGGFPFAEPTLSLSINCRNTQEIARWIERETGILTPTNEWCPKGETPIVATVANDREELDGVRRVVHQLIREDGIAADDIVILDSRSFARSPFSADGDIGPCVVEPISRTAAAVNSARTKTTVRYATIHTFKGLEADIVNATATAAERNWRSSIPSRWLGGPLYSIWKSLLETGG